jgi:hypothetical protein
MRRVIPKAITLVALGALGVALLGGCSRESRRYDTTVQIVRTETVKNRGGTVIDVDLEYTDCPGDQREIFQADAAFALCINRYKFGEKVQASVLFTQMRDGHFDSEIEQVGECRRSRDSQDERSYEIVHQCHDLKVNGVVIGFRCDRKPTRELLAKCPWFRRT